MGALAPKQNIEAGDPNFPMVIIIYMNFKVGIKKCPKTAHNMLFIARVSRVKTPLTLIDYHNILELWTATKC